jgi:hypothetical protein
MSAYVKIGLMVATLVACIISMSTGIAAVKEAQKGTKPSVNPLKGEIISSVVFCVLCMCLGYIAKTIP